MQAHQRPVPTSPSSSNTSADEKHRSRLARLEEEAARVGKTIRKVGTLRLVAVLVAISLALGGFWLGWGSLALLASFVFALAFAGLVVWHARAHRRAARIDAAIRYRKLALERLAGRFAELPSRGERFIDAQHPYAEDLDLFGQRSLFQLLDSTHTRSGESHLAQWLSSPSSLPEVRERQEAVRELAGLDDFREDLAAEGMLLSTEKPDTEPLLAWAEAKEARLFPASMAPLVWFAPISVVGLFSLARFDLIPENGWIAAAIAVAAIGLSRLPKIEPVAAAVASKERSLDGYRALFERIERESFESPRLRGLRDKLGQGELRASREIARLSAIVGFFEARRNEVFRFFIGPALLWDWHCVAALERWRARSGARIRAWLDAAGEIEALSSLASYAADRPDHAFPELVEAPTFDAKQLGHPLLPTERCIRNDVRLDGPGTALLVTGSNMSGKSTLMRAIGTNVVLAMAGAPVCATSLVVSPFELRTSMRVRDSLEDGVSHFYAELLKLKRVLTGLDEPQTLLFLLDEILHGTNSRERRIGARTVLRYLLEHGAMGAVSTHDLGLVDVGPELDARVRKVHLAEQIHDGEMSFDYRLRSGVVQSSNALRLMRLVGIDIDLAAESS